jgi:hypothetical protein
MTVTFIVTVHDTTVSVSCGPFTGTGSTVREAYDRLLSEYTNRLNTTNDKRAQDVVSALAKIMA